MWRDEPWNRALIAGFALAMLLLMSLVPFVALDAAGDTPENLPSVPTEQVEYVCPYSTYTANTLQFNNYTGEVISLFDWYTALPAAGTSDFVGMNFTAPFPNSTTVSVLEDKLWINEITPIDMALVNLALGTTYLEGVPLTPIAVCNTDLMTWNDSEMFDMLMDGLDEWDVNMTIVDRSWFPAYLLDFRIYSSAYIDLESVGSPLNITVFGLWITNCSRETYWQNEESFLYSYYTTQKRYEATLQVSNNISTSHYYDVNWYVGFPANRIVDPATLTVYDLDNLLFLTLGENYDSSNAGVWMSFTRINMSETRSFTFSIYSWNATIGMGGAIAYANDYAANSAHGSGYYLATATWTNTYGRVYNGMVLVELDLDDGVQKYVAAGSVDVYDQEAGRWLEPWEYVSTGGLVIVDYAVVAQGSSQTYDVYFQLDMTSSDRFDITDSSPVLGLSYMMLFLIFAGVLGLAAWWYKSRFAGILALVVLSMTFILYYFSISAGGI
jgi:hypothetical protein